MRFTVSNEGDLENPKFGIYTAGDWSKVWDLDFIYDNHDLQTLITENLSQADLNKITFDSESSMFYAFTSQQKVAQSMVAKFKKAAIKGLQKRLVEYLND